MSFLFICPKKEDNIFAESTLHSPIMGIVCVDEIEEFSVNKYVSDAIDGYDTIVLELSSPSTDIGFIVNDVIRKHKKAIGILRKGTSLDPILLHIKTTQWKLFEYSTAQEVVEYIKSV